MKRKLFRAVSLALTIAAVLVYNISGAYASSAPLKLSAKSAVLIEASSGRVLYQKNAFEKLPMASTTKIMTAIVAIENCRLDDTVVVGRNASGVGGSSIWLSEGERLPLSDMLYGLMLASGNDAAVAIAEHVAGSVDKFAEMMNEKAKRIGAYDTCFSNPNGLPAGNHYTTAYDLALISAYAMKNDVFRQIVGTQYKTIPWQGHEWDRVLKNKNKILWQYEGGNGIKTGFTDDAGRCLSAAAMRDNMQLISVVLGAPDMFRDCMSLMDYGFAEFKNRILVKSGEYMGEVAVKHGTKDGFGVYSEKDVCYPLTEEEYGKISRRVYIESVVKAPVDKDQEIGFVDVWLGDKRICSAPLRAPEEIGDNSYGYNVLKVLYGMLN